MTNEDAISEVPLDEVGIGEDIPQVAAKKVLIENYKIEPVTKDNKVIGDKLILEVKHPDISDRNIEISSVKYQQGDKLKEAGIWIKRDKEGKLPYKSAVATMLRHLGKPNLKALKGDQVDTVVDERGYLCVKAY